MKKRLILLLTVLFLVYQVSATSTTIFNYDFNKTLDEDSLFHYTDSIRIIVNTPVQTTCYYTVVDGSIPSNPFELNFGTSHEKTISDLDEGFHKYYIQCENSSNPIMEVSFKTKKEVSADIQISEETPLNDGTYDITLVTSKSILGEPTLEYSFDGSVYRPIPLSGSGTVWSGHLIIHPNVGEVVGSFRFSATDLEGKEGKTITGEKVFIVDTVVPNVVLSIDAVGYLGEIELSWFSGDEIKEYNIYKSENPGVDFNNFYKTVDDTDYTDTDVEKGKTYYYRVAGVDEAGNIAQFSREISGTALLKNGTISNTGLKINLHGLVDNVITEINLLSDDIKQIQNSNNLKDEREKSFFVDLELEKEYSQAISEIASLKKDVERYKLQDLSELELNIKLDSAKVRVDIIKKKVPESVTLINENKIIRELSEETITKAILEYSQDTFTEKEISNSIKLTNELLKESKISISSELFNLEVLYLDGSKKKISLFRDNIESDLEKDSNKKLILVIPKEIAEKASEIEFRILNFEVIKEDPVLGFDIDTKKIIYTINKHTDINKLEDISINPTHKYVEDTTKKSFITGYSISDLKAYSSGKIGYITLAILLFLLMFYFLFLKIRNNKKSHHITSKIKKAKKHKKKGNTEKLKNVYEEIKMEYKKLSEKEKEKYFPKIKKLNEK